MVYAKDIIFKSGRTQFMVTYLALEVHTVFLHLSLINVDMIYQMEVKENKQVLGFEDVFENPARERILCAACRTKASAARNQLRRWVCHPIISDLHNAEMFLGL
jgi:hypothetical protein